MPDPAPGARSSPLRALLAWLIILGCIVYFIAERRVASKAIIAQTGGLASPQFTLQARYILGMHVLLGSAARPKHAAGAALTRSLPALATDPLRQLRLTAVLGELEGRRAALAHLKNINDTIPPKLQRDDRIFIQIYAMGPGAISTADHDYLLKRHGFFARLAFVFGKPASNPARQAILAAARRTAIAFIAALILGGIALLVGLVLLILAVIFFANGTLRPHFAAVPLPSVRLLEAFALYFLGMAALSLLFRDMLRVHGLVPSASFLLLPIVLLWPAAQFGIPATARMLGWVPAAPDRLARNAVRPFQILTEVGAGILGYVTGLPVMALGVVVTVFLSRFAHVQPMHPIEYFFGKNGWVTLQLFLLACGVAPMVEETFFRGALYGYLRPRCGYFLAALLSALVFAVVHPQGWTTIPVIAAIGFTLASIREWRHSLVATMTAHCLNNLIITTLIAIALS